MKIITLLMLTFYLYLRKVDSFPQEIPIKTRVKTFAIDDGIDQHEFEKESFGSIMASEDQKAQIINFENPLPPSFIATEDSNTLQELQANSKQSRIKRARPLHRSSSMPALRTTRFRSSSFSAPRTSGTRSSHSRQYQWLRRPGSRYPSSMYSTASGKSSYSSTGSKLERAGQYLDVVDKVASIGAAGTSIANNIHNMYYTSQNSHYNIKAQQAIERANNITANAQAFDLERSKEKAEYLGGEIAKINKDIDKLNRDIKDYETEISELRKSPNMTDEIQDRIDRKEENKARARADIKLLQYEIRQYKGL